MMIHAPEPEKPIAMIVPMGERAEVAGLRLLADLRRGGIAADMAYRGNMKKRLSRANDAGAAYALIIGDVELDSGEAQVKNLTTGDQRSVAFDAIAEALRS
jgi:histidyl-tRNA synthetase